LHFLGQPASMQTMTRGTWTDERLDEFAKRIDERFDRVDERFSRVDERFDRVDERFAAAERVNAVRFDEVSKRFDGLTELVSLLLEGQGSMQRSMVGGAIALTAGFMAGFAALIALIATQL
jgi:hypothetical protein